MANMVNAQQDLAEFRGGSGGGVLLIKYIEWGCGLQQPFVDICVQAGADLAFFSHQPPACCSSHRDDLVTMLNHVEIEC